MILWKDKIFLRLQKFLISLEDNLYKTQYCRDYTYEFLLCIIPNL